MQQLTLLALLGPLLAGLCGGVKHRGSLALPFLSGLALGMLGLLAVWMAYLITVGLPILFLTVFTTREYPQSLDPPMWFSAASWLVRNESSIVVLLCVAASAFVYLHMWPHTVRRESVIPSPPVGRS